MTQTNDNSQSASSFWRIHLRSTDGPMIHFVSSDLVDFEAVKKFASEIGFAVFVVDATGINSESDLMDVFATSMNFPSYFGKNWNALLDLTTDLSWAKAEGYVLIISVGDNLLSLPHQEFSILVDVMEATVRDWRDERGEFGERTGPVPFHVIFVGNDELKEPLLAALSEPFCEHTGPTSVNFFPPPVRLRSTATYQDAEKLLFSGADAELVLSFFREHGMDERDSMYSIAGLMGKTITEAKALIHNSQTWSEVRERDERIRKIARDALKDFGWEDD